MPPARAVFYAATFAVAVLGARSALIRPIGLGWALAVALGYAALLLSSVLVLRLRVFVDAVTHGPAGARGVALTFDDGPHPVFTRKVLDRLDQEKVKATFFVVGKKAEASPDLVREIVRRGHAIGLHSYAHDRLFSLRSSTRVRRDLARGIEVLEQITGERPALFRPPIGHTNPQIARVADELDFVVVGWTVSGRDGLGSAEPGRVAQRVRTNLEDGAIVLLHDAPERGDYEPAGVRALDEVLGAIRARGLEVVPLEPWLH